MNKAKQAVLSLVAALLVAAVICSWQWFTLEEARDKVRPNSLARDFLEGMLDGEYHFHDDKYSISKNK